ncbi:MAG: hypothetical protein ACXWRE_13240 [Pseudobdellovibrionaceae bacterium]
MSTVSIIPSKELSPRSAKRFVFFDLLRFISIFVIVPFHLSEFGFNSEAHPIYSGSLLNTSIIKLAKFIPFSGHTVLFLSFFLIGYGLMTRGKLFKLTAWCFFGYVAVLFSYYEAPYPLFYWDIFSFLIVSLSLSFIFLAIPYGFLASLLLGLGTSSASLLDWNLEALSGSCSVTFQSSWPLLPWGFYAAYFACLGREIRLQRWNWLSELQKRVTQYGIGLLLFFSLGSVFILKGITGVPATGGMYCFIQSFSFLQKVFLILIWSLLFLYGSGKGNLKWSQSWIKYLSVLSWNRNFSLAYVIQIILVGVVTSYPETFMSTSRLYDASLVGIFIGTELFTHAILGLMKLAYNPRQI